MFRSLPVDQTRIRHYLSMLQWHTVLTGSTQLPYHLCNMLHHSHKVPQQLETHHCCEGNSMFWSFPLDQTRVRDYLSMPQWHTVLTGSTWIASTHTTCSTSATRILDTWRNSTATKASQRSGHLYCIKP